MSTMISFKKQDFIQLLEDVSDKKILPNESIVDLVSKYHAKLRGDAGMDEDQDLTDLSNDVADMAEMIDVLNTNIAFFVEAYNAQDKTSSGGDIKKIPPPIRFLKDCRALSDVSDDVIFNELKSLYLKAIVNEDCTEAVGYLTSIRVLVSLLEVKE